LLFFLSVAISILISSIITVTLFSQENLNIEKINYTVYKYQCNENPIWYSLETCYGDNCTISEKKPIQHCDEHYYEKEVFRYE